MVYQIFRSRMALYHIFMIFHKYWLVH